MMVHLDTVYVKFNGQAYVSKLMATGGRNIVKVVGATQIEFLFAVTRPSVCLSSVCLSSVALVRPTQAVEILGNISTALGTLAIR